MTALQELLAEVGDDARRVDPRRLASRAMADATRQRRTTRVGGAAGMLAATGLVLVLWSLAGADRVIDVVRPGSAGAGSERTFYSPGPHELVRILLAAAFALAAGVLVGWRERATTVVPRLERALAGLWAASLALWVVGAVELFHAVFVGLHFIGHPYVTLVGTGAVPLLAVLLLVNGSAAVRRLTVLALAAQSAVVLSLLYTTPFSGAFAGESRVGTTLSVAEALVAGLATVWLTWRSRLPRVASPSWQLAALWSAGTGLLLGLFFHLEPAVGVLFYSDWEGVPGLGRGAVARAICWSVGTLVALLVVSALWWARDDRAGLAVVVGVMVTVLAGCSLNLYANTYPALGRGWGPYLGWWWLSGLPVLAWLAVHRSNVQRRATGAE